jgi:O-Antigen ligase
MYIKLFYILIIILAANGFLNFGWWWHVHGVFNISDIGNFLVFFGLVIISFKKNISSLFHFSQTYLIIFYLLFVVLQISLAGLYYNQPILRGFIGARHQFYYLSFFFFFLAIDNTQTIRLVLNWLTILSLFAIFLGVLNYSGFQILTHKWASGHGVRSGIIRPFIPAMPVISISFFWELSKFICNRSFSLKYNLTTIILLSCHFFRQTRMRIIGVLFILLGTLLLKKRYRDLIFLLIIGIISIVTVELTMKENFIIDPLFSVFDNTMHSTGASWRGRLNQVSIAIDEFKKHPIIGSGAISIRTDNFYANHLNEYDLSSLAYMSDWGYLHWIKAYGLIGAIWLFAFLSIFLKGAFNINKTTKIKTDPDIALFCRITTIFFTITFVTLNHLMFPASIPLVCLVFAIISKSNIQASKFS